MRRKKIIKRLKGGYIYKGNSDLEDLQYYHSLFDIEHFREGSDLEDHGRDDISTYSNNRYSKTLGSDSTSTSTIIDDNDSDDCSLVPSVVSSISLHRVDSDLSSGSVTQSVVEAIDLRHTKLDLFLNAPISIPSDSRAAVVDYSNKFR